MKLNGEEDNNLVMKIISAGALSLCMAENASGGGENENG